MDSRTRAWNWILRLIGGICLAVGGMLPAARLVSAALPADYAEYAARYTQGLNMVRCLLALGGIALMLGAPYWRSLFVSTTARRGDRVFTRKDLWIGAGLLALAGLLRIIQLDSSLTIDEVFLVKALITQSPIRIFLHPSGSAHIFATLTSNLLVRGFGLSDGVIHLPAFVLGTLSPTLLYLFLALNRRRCAGLIGGIILCLNPLHIWYSQEAKGNVPLVFFVVASWLCLALLARRWRGVTAWAYVVCLVGAGLSHLSGILWIFGQLLVVVALPLQPAGEPNPAMAGKTDITRLKALGLHMAGLFAVLIVYAPIIPFLTSAGGKVTSQEGSARLGFLLMNIASRFTVLDAPQWLMIPSIAALFCGVIALIRCRHDILALTAGSFAVGIIFLVLSQTFSHARYHMAFLPGVVLLAAVGVATLLSGFRSGTLRGRLAAALGVGLAVLFLAGESLSLAGYYRQPKSNYRAIASYLASENQDIPAYVVGVNKGGYPALAMTRYTDDFFTTEDLAKQLSSMRPEAEMWVVVLDPMHLAVSYPELKRALEQHGSPVREFECLGELDQFRVRTSFVWRVTAEAFRHRLTTTENRSHDIE
ncbi:MAG: hypothetical protein HN919_00935 [Verrucomicrobia bacterium]|nr:hypothetical protein [Verrucomicrobiota bacterium]